MLGYNKEISQKHISGKNYIITNFTPKLKDLEKQQIDNEVKEQLFEVFKKCV